MEKKKSTVIKKYQNGGKPKPTKRIIFAEAPVRTIEELKYFDTKTGKELKREQAERRKIIGYKDPEFETSKEEVVFSEIEEGLRRGIDFEETRGYMLDNYNFDIGASPELRDFYSSTLGYSGDEYRERLRGFRGFVLNNENIVKVLSKAKFEGNPIYENTETKFVIREEVNPTFPDIEAKKVKRLSEEVDGIPAEIVPLYKGNFDEVKKKYNKEYLNDKDVVILGHRSDSNMFGKTIKDEVLPWLKEGLDQDMNCYGGVCYGDSMAKVLGGLPNFVANIDRPWVGVPDYNNFRNKGSFEEIFFGNKYGKTGVETAKAVYGKDYTNYTKDPVEPKAKFFDVNNLRRLGISFEVEPQEDMPQLDIQPLPTLRTNVRLQNGGLQENNMKKKKLQQGGYGDLFGDAGNLLRSIMGATTASGMFNQQTGSYTPISGEDYLKENKYSKPYPKKDFWGNTIMYVRDANGNELKAKDVDAEFKAYNAAQQQSFTANQDQFNKFLPITQNLAGLFDLQQREKEEIENKKLRVQDFPTSNSTYAPVGFAKDGGGINTQLTLPSLKAIMEGLPKGMSKKHIEMVAGSANKEAFQLQQSLGYKKNSPFKNLQSQDFYTDTITMDDVDDTLMAIADTGEKRLLKPNSGLHKFLGATKITEVPIAQGGGLYSRLSGIFQDGGETAPPFKMHDYLRSEDVRNRFIKNYKEYNPNATDEEAAAYADNEIKRRLEAAGTLEKEKFGESIDFENQKRKDIFFATTNGYYNPDAHKYAVNEDPNKDKMEYVGYHESHHGSNKGSVSPEEKMKYYEALNPGAEKYRDENYKYIKDKGSKDFSENYDESTSEFAARVFELREYAHKNKLSEGGKNVTPEELQKIYEHKEEYGNPYIEGRKSDILKRANIDENDPDRFKKLAELLNSIVDSGAGSNSSNVARNGGNIKFPMFKQVPIAQDGGSYSWSNPSEGAATVNTPSRTEQARSDRKDLVKSEEKRIKEINDLSLKILQSKKIGEYSDEEIQILSQSTLEDAQSNLREDRITKANSAQQRGDSWSAEGLKNSTAAVGDKLSLQRLPVVGKYIPSMLDVTGGIFNMAAGLGAIPYNIQEGNYGKAAFDLALPLGMGALGGLGTKTTGQFVNNLVNPIAGADDLIRSAPFAKEKLMSKKDFYTKSEVEDILNKKRNLVELKYNAIKEYPNTDFEDVLAIRPDWEKVYKEGTNISFNDKFLRPEDAEKIRNTLDDYHTGLYGNSFLSEHSLKDFTKGIEEWAISPQHLEHLRRRGIDTNSPEFINYLKESSPKNILEYENKPFNFVFRPGQMNKNGGNPQNNNMKNTTYPNTYQDGGDPNKYSNLAADQKVQYFTTLQRYVKDNGIEALEDTDEEAAEFYKAAALEVVMSNDDDGMEYELPEIEFKAKKTSTKKKEENKVEYNPFIDLELPKAKTDFMLNNFGIEFKKIGTKKKTSQLDSLTKTLQSLLAGAGNNQQMIFDPREISNNRIGNYRQGGSVFDKSLVANEDSKAKSYLDLLQMIPIQTEKLETIVLPDGSLVGVNATKRHSKMTDDEVTDIVPESSYILSQFGDTKIYKEEADKIALEMKAEPYNTYKAAKVPEVKTLGDIMKFNVMTPADLSRVVANRFKIIEGNDPFIEQTNASNKFNRTAYLQAIIGLSEYDKARKGLNEEVMPQMIAKQGGSVKAGYKLPNYQNSGGASGGSGSGGGFSPWSIIPQAISSIYSIFSNEQAKKLLKKNTALNAADILKYGTAAKQNNNLGFGLSMGIDSLVNPVVTPAINDSSYIDSIYNNNLAYLNNVGRRLTTDAFNNRLDTSSMNAQQAMMFGERDAAQRYDSLGKSAVDLAKTRADLFTKYAESKQGIVNQNIGSRVAAQNATQANMNQQRAIQSGKVTALFENDTNILSNILGANMANRGNYAANLSQINSSTAQTLQNTANVGFQMYSQNQARNAASSQASEARVQDKKQQCFAKGGQWIIHPDGTQECSI